MNKKITIINRLGLHARAANRFVKSASQFDCEVQVAIGDRTANGKSIMELIMLAAGKGTTIELICTGSEEQRAITELALLVQNCFGEGE